MRRGEDGREIGPDEENSSNELKEKKKLSLLLKYANKPQNCSINSLTSSAFNHVMMWNTDEKKQEAMTHAEGEAFCTQDNDFQEDRCTITAHL